MLLADADAHRQPFRYAVSRAGLDVDTVGLLRALFRDDAPWARHQDHFYRCWIAVVTDEVPASLREVVRQRVVALLDLPLATDVFVTAQRMEATDGATVHTDRPLVGYEAARLVVQLDADWSRHDGGLFLVHADEQGPAVDEVVPRVGGAVAFELSRSSFHTVTPTSRVRNTVVFNLWHAGNPPDLAPRVVALFDGLRFDRLPRVLDPLLRAADEAGDTDAGEWLAHRAWALSRWGFGDDEVVQACATEVAALPDDLRAGRALADWATHLRLVDFHRPAWEAVVQAVRGVDEVRVRAAAAALCVPISP